MSLARRLSVLLSEMHSVREVRMYQVVLAKREWVRSGV